jgi:hypothetical protein
MVIFRATIGDAMISCSAGILLVSCLHRGLQAREWVLKIQFTNGFKVEAIKSAEAARCIAACAAYPA